MHKQAPAEPAEPQPQSLLRHPGRHPAADHRAVHQRPAAFDATYQRYLLKAFRDHLPFKDVAVKLYLRSRRTDTLGEAAGEGADGGKKSVRVRTRTRSSKKTTGEIWKDV